MENGAMRVGPHSAGSIPGPACYGRGGTQPTVTDANLYLGRLGAKSLLGGDMSLDTAATAAAIEGLAPEANLGPTEFAEGILAISNAAMADAMRTITVSQGVDPRAFTLVAFGGAGPMAAAFLAEELDISEVLIPKFPGTFSAWGMLQTDLRHDFTQSFFQPADRVEPDEFERCYAELEAEGRASILNEGIEEHAISFQRSADMRYTGQEYTINVVVPAQADRSTIMENFNEAHQRRYGHSSPGSPIEFVNIRVAAIGAVSKFDHAQAISEGAGKHMKIGEREAVFQGQAYATPVLARDRLTAGEVGMGPAIIEEQSATTVVPPGWRIEVDSRGNVLLKRGES
jgi:N-methylhydantoinase A